MQTQPHFSIVIPARNEEASITACLGAIEAAGKEHPCSLEIIVVLNRCTDRTEEIARAAGCRIVVENAKNLAVIRNAGVRQAHGEVIITVDADSRVSKNMLKAIDASLALPSVVGGGVLIVPERWSLGIAITGLYLLPIALRYGISAGLFFCRRTDFDAIGGFDERLVSVEDIDFARRLKAHGRKEGRRFVTLLRASITTSCRKFDRLGDWYFVFRPHLVWTLLKGRNQSEADKIWYEFER
ncbi:MAG: glycosyltransferase [Deltaproteobacteria bacterium]|nr:glycosyltransferase [Deltaproteobacteria bacterium]